MLQFHFLPKKKETLIVNYEKESNNYNLDINFDEGKNNSKQYFKGELPNIKNNLRNGKYYDPYFTNSISSYVNDGYKEDDLLDEYDIENIKEDIEYYKKNYVNKKYDWIRLSDLLSLERGEHISENEIDLGNDFILTILQGILKFQPEKYFKLLGGCFPEIGYYEFNFIEDRKIVFVDDYLPISRLSCLYFSSLPMNERFTIGINLIFEKACAKYAGCYFNMEFSQKYFRRMFQISNLLGFSLNTISIDKISSNLNKNNILICYADEENDFHVEGLEPLQYYLIKSVESMNIIKLNDLLGNERIIRINDLKKYFSLKMLSFEVENPIEINDEDFEDDAERNMYILDQYEKKEDGQIDYNKYYKQAKGLLDSINIKNDLKKSFFEKYKNNNEKGLYDIFNAFITSGTRKSSFMSLVNN